MLSVPVTFTQAFHSTQEGHTLIAPLLLYNLSAVNAKQMGTYFPTTTCSEDLLFLRIRMASNPPSSQGGLPALYRCDLVSSR